MTSLVTAMLAWWDEPPDLLYSCVTSVACVADRVVALDGGYRLSPTSTVTSPPEQADAIRQAAKDADLNARVLIPDRLWVGQVEKRDWLIREAAKDATWVMPLDADWYVTGVRSLVRDELEHEHDVDALAIPFFTPVPDDDGFDLAKKAAHPWHADLAGKTQLTDLVFRALPGIRVETRHWWYSAIKNEKRVGLWGCVGVYQQAPRRPLESPLHISHMCFYRDQMRIDRNRIYSATRDLEVAQTGIET